MTGAFRCCSRSGAKQEFAAYASFPPKFPWPGAKPSPTCTSHPFVGVAAHGGGGLGEGHHPNKVPDHNPCAFCLTIIGIAANGVGGLGEGHHLVVLRVADGRVDRQLVADVLRLEEPAYGKRRWEVWDGPAAAVCSIACLLRSSLDRQTPGAPGRDSALAARVAANMGAPLTGPAGQ